MRLVTAQLGTIIMLIITVMFTKIDTDTWQVTFFSITMASTIIINSCSAMYSGAIMGLACSFPSTYVQASMNGQAIAGVFASLANIAALTVGLSDEDSSFYYFLIALCTVVLSLLAYLCISRTVFFKCYIQQARDAEARAEVDSLIHGHSRNSVCFVFKNIALQGISIFLVFTGTLSAFPAITDLIVSTNASDESQFTNQYFIPVTTFLIFNFGDLTGRVVSGVVRLPSQRKPFCLFLFTIARLALIPLLMLCNEHPRHSLPVVFNSDVAFVFIVLFIGLTNGYFANLAFIYAPLQVGVEYRDTSGAMMAFFMGIGLTAGALLSNLLVRLL